MLNSSSVVPIRLRDFFKGAADITINVDNDKVFLPDPSWSKTFAAGLSKLPLTRAHVIEVGVGSGINMAGLLTSDKNIRSFIGVDLVDDAVDASRILADTQGWDVRIGQSDLLENVGAKSLMKATHIIACIPQVPKHEGEVHSGRELSDYYLETGIKEDSYGLGLIARLLDQTAERARNATLILNIAERPGKDRIEELFRGHGFAYSTIHQDRVQQDPTTSLESLARIERETGLPFHFYAGPQTNMEIGAQEAESLRVAGKPIYHNLAVYSARLG